MTPGPVILRLARTSDEPRLVELARNAYGHYVPMLDEPPAPILLDYGVVAAAGNTYVAANAEQILGMVTIERADTEVILRNLAVHPDCQGRGIGKRLTFLVEDVGIVGGFSGVRLWTRAEMSENIAFYRKLDYDITHVEETEHYKRVFFFKTLRECEQECAIHDDHPGNR